jgi:sugar fermentation stimulation protein A
MQFDPPLQEARLLQRYKRFLADIETLDGERLTVHCPNTGSMLNCMSPGGRIWFSRSADPRRKLPGTWELAETPHGRLACINTARANALVEEALHAGVIGELAGFNGLRREVRFGAENSRIDFVLDFARGPVFVEVKSVTLGFADSAVAAFPDAPSARASKHLRELTRLARQGVRAVQLYCVNLSGIQAVRPAQEIDPLYAASLAEARAAGVQVLAYASRLSPLGLQLQASLPVLERP